MKDGDQLAMSIFLAVALIVVGMPIRAFLVKLLWNAIMPDIFGLTTLTYWQAFGVSLLSQVLFKGSTSSRKRDD